MDSTQGDIPVKGKRYILRSRPWNMSYLEIKEDPTGDWVYDPQHTDNKDFEWIEPLKST